MSSEVDRLSKDRLRTRALLRDANLSPKKSFGQNFLIAPHVVANIARACVPDTEIGRAHVLELGAGLGVLTKALAERAKRVVAVERDRDLVPILKSELVSFGEKVEVVEGDAQAADPSVLLANADGPRVLCGNLPYQITGRLLEQATVHADAIERAVFMVQLEVAERLAAEAGTKEYGALTVFVRAAFRTSKLFNVSKDSFHPPPEVTSAVILLESERPRRAEETSTFRALVKGAFGMRRKTLRNAWASVGSREDVARAAALANVSLDARGETLTVDDFARVAKALEG